MKKITQHAVLFAALSLFCCCHSRPRIDQADKSRLITPKYDFSLDPDLASVSAHEEEAKAQETQEEISNFKRLLELIDDTVNSATNNSPYPNAKNGADPNSRMLFAKMTLARDLHALNQLKRQFANDLGVKIVSGDKVLSFDSTANSALQLTYADAAIVKEQEFGNQIDGRYFQALARRLQKPKLPPLPHLPKFIRRLFRR
jgi:hypothetical protein